MSAEELAEASGVGLRTIRRAEQEEGISSVTRPNAVALQTALESRGVVFIPGDKTGGPGVRLKKKNENLTVNAL